jgi:hypothetical protein
MAASEPAALIAELEWASERRSPERWSEILRQITSLFLIAAHRLTDAQIVVFDAVFLQLVERVDAQTLALLSGNLSGLSTAPPNTMRRLALHDEILVAGPVLRRSNHLTDRNLVEIASLRGEEHLLEIASRKTVSASLSDELVARGELSVLGRLTQNLGVKFSQDGCVALVAIARQDRGLAEQVARRSDLPPALRRQLVAKVTDDRTRFLQTVPSSLQGKIRTAVATTVERVEFPAPTQADYSAAMAKMVELSRKGGLNDRSVNSFAVKREYMDVVAALSFLSGAPVNVILPLLHTAELDGLVVACKAARLNWSTTTMIVRHRPGAATVAEKEIERAKATFDALSLSVAQRTIRLW